MKPKAPDKDPRLQAMRLCFVAEQEQQQLVAAWPAVGKRNGTPAMFREWYAIAGVEGSYRISRWARALLKTEICLKDGSVDPDVARVLGASAIARIVGQRARKR